MIEASEAKQLDETLAGWPDVLIAEMPWIVVGFFVLFAGLELAGRSFGPKPNTSFGRLSTNFGLILISSLIGLLVPLSSVAGALVAEEAGWGLFNLWVAPWWLVLLAAALGRTFLAYWLHRAFHAVPLLWRIHQVHHSDTHFDLTLSLRNHPFDYLLRMVLFAGLTVILGLPVWAIVLVDVALIVANYWEHVDASLSPRLQRILGTVLATPDIHRLHHSAWQPQTDSNFGGGLIIWDRLFGTYRSPMAEQAERIGLGDEQDRIAQSLGAQLLLPFASRKSERVRETTQQGSP